MSQIHDPAATKKATEQKGRAPLSSLVMSDELDDNELAPDLADDDIMMPGMAMSESSGGASSALPPAKSVGSSAAPTPSPATPSPALTPGKQAATKEAARGARLEALGIPSVQGSNAPIILPTRTMGEAGKEFEVVGEGEAGSTIAGTPTNLGEVAQMDADDLKDYPGNAGTAMPCGPEARPIMLKAFGANWFFAKDVLLGGKWPAAISREAPLVKNKDLAQLLMWKLLALRNYEYDGLLQMLREKYKAKEGGTPKDSDILDWGAAGSVTITSDIDVNLGGKYNMQAVPDFNAEFKKRGWPYEAGTAFDVNVYCKDNMHGFDFEAMAAQPAALREDHAATAGVMTIATEKNLPTDVADQEDDLKNQEVAAMVKLLRFMAHGHKWQEVDEWARYKRAHKCDDETPAKERPAEQYRKILQAQVRYNAWLSALEEMKKKLARDGAIAVDALVGVDADNKSHRDAAIDMQASNRLYEDKIKKLIELRAYIADLTTKPGDNVALIRQVAIELRQVVLEAGMFANEAMITAGASNFVVFGTQLGVKEKVIGKADKALGGGGAVKSLTMKLTEAQFYHAFTEQFADTIKEFHHFDRVDQGLLKGGKYLMRMTLAADQLDGVDPQTVPYYEKLRRLGDFAMTAKNMDGTMDAVNDVLWTAIRAHITGLADVHDVDGFIEAVMQFGTTVTSQYQAAKAGVAVPAKPTNTSDPNYEVQKKQYEEALAQKKGTKLKIAELKGEDLTKWIEVLTNNAVHEKAG